MLTGREIVDRMKGYEFLNQLLSEERTALNSTLDRFLVLNPSLADLQINVVFEKEPKDDEIIRVGRKVLPDIERFQETLKVISCATGHSASGAADDVGTP
ncbi:hypothetical protein [Mesorhizobium sp. M0040]|uniref:hypothetical protein n=1 Tax=Mesorhizobium sp. M0040 TaxID=2956855 RepID=UPI00333BCC16